MKVFCCCIPKKKAVQPRKAEVGAFPVAVTEAKSPKEMGQIFKDIDKSTVPLAKKAFKLKAEWALYQKNYESALQDNSLKQLLTEMTGLKWVEETSSYYAVCFQTDSPAKAFQGSLTPLGKVFMYMIHQDLKLKTSYQDDDLSIPLKASELSVFTAAAGQPKDTSGITNKFMADAFLGLESAPDYSVSDPGLPDSVITFEGVSGPFSQPKTDPSNPYPQNLEPSAPVSPSPGALADDIDLPPHTDLPPVGAPTVLDFGTGLTPTPLAKRLAESNARKAQHISKGTRATYERTAQQSVDRGVITGSTVAVRLALGEAKVGEQHNQEARLRGETAARDGARAVEQQVVNEYADATRSLDDAKKGHQRSQNKEMPLDSIIGTGLPQ